MSTPCRVTIDENDYQREISDQSEEPCSGDDYNDYNEEELEAEDE